MVSQQEIRQELEKIKKETEEKLKTLKTSDSELANQQKVLLKLTN